MNRKWMCLSHQHLQCCSLAWHINDRKPGLEMVMNMIIMTMMVIHEEEEENPIKRAH